MRRVAFAALLALVAPACADEGLDRDEAEESCARFEGTTVEPGCTQSEFEACVNCQMGCADGCILTPRLTTCSADKNWSCSGED